MTQARIFEFSGKYIVEVLVENGGNGFLLDHIECEGLNFEMAEKRTQESPMGLKYDDVRSVKYQSVYPAVAVFRKGDATRRLEIQIWVEDAQSIQQKLDVMQSFGIKGVAEWRLQFETADVWDTISNYMNQ